MLKMQQLQISLFYGKYTGIRILKVNELFDLPVLYICL